MRPLLGDPWDPMGKGGLKPRLAVFGSSLRARHLIIFLFFDALEILLNKLLKAKKKSKIDK